MKKLNVLTRMLLLVALLVGSTSVWGAEDDVHDLSITQGTGLNNNAAIPSIEIDDPGYTIKQVQVGWKYNKSVDDIVTIEVTIGETSLGTQTVGGKTSNVAYFNASDLEGDITISFTNHAGDGTGKGTFYIQSVKLKEGAPKADYWRATYVYNDGVTANKVVNVNKGDDAAAYTLEAAPTRSNFDFLGWNDGTNNYDGGASYPMTSNKTFTAQWEYSGPCTKYNKSSKSDLATGAQYILVGNKSGTYYFANNDIASNHYYFSGSTVSNVNSNITEAKAIIVDEEPLVLTLEETADGWYLKNTDGKKLAMYGDKKMNWNDGDMTWDLGGSDDVPTFSAKNDNKTYILKYNSGANPTRFNGYESGQAATYFYRLDNGKNVYTLTLDFNDGVTEDGTHKVLETADYTLTTPTRSGYAFMGWNTAEDGTGTNYNAGAYTMPAAATTLYAQWRPNTVSATVTSAGWATYVTPYAVEFSEGDAYVVTAAGTSTTLEAVTKVPADTPVLLKDEGTKTATVIASATDPASNLLKVSNGSVVGDDATIYVLANKDNGVGFYLWDKTAAAIPEGKVYLDTKGSGAKGLEFISFENAETDGIKAVSTKVENGVRYNLAGQRVGKDYKGIVIVNGKKMLNK